MVKHCENSVFWVIYVKKEKISLESRPFHRDGRVTGNKHHFLLGLSSRTPPYIHVCIYLPLHFQENKKGDGDENMYTLKVVISYIILTDTLHEEEPLAFIIQECVAAP